MRKVRSGLVAGLLLSVLALAACGGGDDESAGASAQGGGGIDTVPVSQFGGQKNADRLKDLYRRAMSGGQHTITIIGGAPPSEIKLFEAFGKDFPDIKFRPLSATGSQITAKVNAEFSSGKHNIDLAETSVILLLGLNAQDKLVKNAVFTAKGLDSAYVGPGESFYAVSLAPFGLSYNSNEVKEGDLPKTWGDLLSPKWKGKIAMGDATVLGPASQAVTAMLSSGRYDAGYFSRLAAQGPQVTPPSNPNGTTDAIVQGAKQLGLPASQKFTVEAHEKGAPIGFKLWARDNYVAANSIAMMKGAPNELAARLYMNWLLTPRGGEAVAKNISAYSALPGAPAPRGLPSLKDVDALPPIPATKLKAAQDQALAVARQAFGT
jgi:iron(III) transport system substrate-binding protein